MRQASNHKVGEPLTQTHASLHGSAVSGFAPSFAPTPKLRVGMACSRPATGDYIPGLDLPLRSSIEDVLHDTYGFSYFEISRRFAEIEAYARKARH